MIRDISTIRTRYYLPLTTAALWMLPVVITAAAGRLVEKVSAAKSAAENVLNVRHSSEYEAVHNRRIRFAADHGVADPASLVAAVRYSPMANLLISVAIEESRGDPAAVGSAGEQGAWQVKASDWGSVPKDIHGQACQAERIIRGLLTCTYGNKKTALARYNGGTTPPGKSYRYAERILKRAGHLQIAVKYLPPDYFVLREALLVLSVNSRLL
jgi:soluble lytic murein transglycosylase-like protein